MDIYSTLTRSKENFETINKNRVNLFVCGPTVYDDAHIGHGRTYISFDTIKRYKLSVESSVTVSFNDFDKTIIRKAKENKDVDVKKLKDEIKADLTKDLVIINKLTNRMRHLSGIFYNYVEKVVSDVIADKSSRISQKVSQNEKYYMKVGHYLVNFNLFEKSGVPLNSLSAFKGTDLYRKLFKEK